MIRKAVAGNSGGRTGSERLQRRTGSATAGESAFAGYLADCQTLTQERVWWNVTPQGRIRSGGDSRPGSNGGRQTHRSSGGTGRGGLSQESSPGFGKFAGFAKQQAGSEDSSGAYERSEVPGDERKAVVSDRFSRREAASVARKKRRPPQGGRRGSRVSSEAGGRLR